MTPLEKRATFSLATLFGLRMLGLFMIVPVFSPYASHLTHATPFLIGLALGIYGFTQALFQIPLGTLSDHVPRKHVIALGFLIFITGSMIAALSNSIHGVMLGRALQGAGAIGSTIIALLTDITAEEHRSKAMAIIGIIIGCSFFLAMMLGPALNQWIGVPGIFGLTSVFGAIAIIILYTLVPSAPIITTPQTTPFSTRFKLLLGDRQLVNLDIGIFCLHAILTASFLVVPLLLLALPNTAHNTWQLYLSTMSIAIVLTFGLIGWAEKTKQVYRFYIISIFGLFIAEIWLWQFHHTYVTIGLGLLVFFTAFNTLEANLPSMVSRLAPPAYKGMAIGIYSTCQFLGIFFGGIIGGWLYGHYSPQSVLFISALLALVWLWIASKNRVKKITSS